MFSTLDSQPQEWLENNPKLLHTLSVCCFRDSASAKAWIHKLVPQNRNGRLIKWSDKGQKAQLKLKRRRQFIEQVEAHYGAIDFSVHCISSTEEQISRFANAFFLQNLQNITQQVDAKGRNCLVLKITKKKEITLPALQAANLIWIYYCLKYMKEVNNLHGFILSDWFATGSDPVALVNFLLSSTGLDLQISIAKDPAASEADLLSDWFAGWANSSKSATVDPDIAAKFEKLIERAPAKIDWIMYDCDLQVVPGLPGHAAESSDRLY